MSLQPVVPLLLAIIDEDNISDFPTSEILCSLERGLPVVRVTRSSGGNKVAGGHFVYLEYIVEPL